MYQFLRIFVISFILVFMGCGDTDSANVDHVVGKYKGGITSFGWVIAWPNIEELDNKTVLIDRLLNNEDIVMDVNGNILEIKEQIFDETTYSQHGSYDFQTKLKANGWYLDGRIFMKFTQEAKYEGDSIFNLKKHGTIELLKEI